MKNTMSFLKLAALLFLTVTSFAKWAEASSLITGVKSPSEQYADVVKHLEAVATTYSQNAQIFDLGMSDSGEMIKGLKIGNGERQNLLVGTHHGNEYGSTEVAIAFADALAKEPIAGQTLYVIPILNISGYNRGNRNEYLKNGMSYDANRDYPSPCRGDDQPFRLKSTKALADFIGSHQVVTSATLHTYDPSVLYPWGISTKDLDTGYTDIFLALGKSATFMSNYKVGNSTDMLYPADGTFEDYAFWHEGMWSMLFELGFSHNPSESQVNEMIRVNVPGLRKMFAEAPALRAKDHNFSGKCDGRLSILLDRHDE
jgi:carboxypeptidase T